MASNTKKRIFDIAFKPRVVEYAEQNTNRGAGVGMEELLFLHPPNNSNEFDKNQFKVPIKRSCHLLFL